MKKLSSLCELPQLVKESPFKCSSRDCDERYNMLRYNATSFMRRIPKRKLPPVTSMWICFRADPITKEQVCIITIFQRIDSPQTIWSLVKQAVPL